MKKDKLKTLGRMHLRRAGAGPMQPEIWKLVEW